MLWVVGQISSAQPTKKAQPDRQLAEQDHRRLARHDPDRATGNGDGPDDQPENSVHGTTTSRVSLLRICAAL